MTSWTRVNWVLGHPGGSVDSGGDGGGGGCDGDDIGMVIVVWWQLLWLC